MAILITGGAGFVGSHLVEQLLRATDQALVVLDNFNDYYDPRQKRSNAAFWPGQPRITVVEGDFCDADLVNGVLIEHQVRSIFHLGGSPGVPASLQYPRQNVANNVLGTATLLEAARRLQSRAIRVRILLHRVRDRGRPPLSSRMPRSESPPALTARASAPQRFSGRPITSFSACRSYR